MNTPISRLLQAVSFKPKTLTVVLVLTNQTTIIATLHELEEEGKVLLTNPRRIELGVANSNGNKPLLLKQYIHSQIIQSSDFILMSEQIQSLHFPTQYMLEMYQKTIAGKSNMANTTSTIVPEETTSNETSNGNVVFVNFNKNRNQSQNNEVVKTVPEDYGKDEPDPPSAA